MVNNQLENHPLNGFEQINSYNRISEHLFSSDPLYGI